MITHCCRLLKSRKLQYIISKNHYECIFVLVFVTVIMSNNNNNGGLPLNNFTVAICWRSSGELGIRIWTMPIVTQAAVHFGVWQWYSLATCNNKILFCMWLLFLIDSVCTISPVGEADFLVFNFEMSELCRQGTRRLEGILEYICSATCNKSYFQNQTILYTSRAPWYRSHGSKKL